MHTQWYLSDFDQSPSQPHSLHHQSPRPLLRDVTQSETNNIADELTDEHLRRFHGQQRAIGHEMAAEKVVDASWAWLLEG